MDSETVIRLLRREQGDHIFHPENDSNSFVGHRVPHRLGAVGKDNPKCMWMALSPVLPFILPFSHHVSQSVSQLEVKEAKIHKT